jgi:tRNA threonylcarbamoyladenosine biosynthesis protein TsaB
MFDSLVQQMVRMLVLGIETSGLEGSVAIVRDNDCLGEKRLNQIGRRHAQALVLEIGQLLNAHSLTPRDVDLVAVSRGPGSFTGLRVGMVCAKTFAYATGCRFISVDTFAAIAENAPADVTRVFVIEDAQRDDLFVGEYARNPDQAWEQVSPIRIVSADEFLQSCSDMADVMGPGVAKFETETLPNHWLKDPHIRQPSASMIASLGRLREPSTAGEPFAEENDFWRASPFYLRMSAAEEKRASMMQAENP